MWHLRISFRAEVIFVITCGYELREPVVLFTHICVMAIFFIAPSPSFLSYVKQSSGNPLTEQESEATPTKVVCSPEKITEEIKAKIEEEAYNKG